MKAEALPDLDLPDDPRFLANLAHFATALRRAGLPLGADRMINLVSAINATGFGARDDFYHILRACLVSRREHLAVFDQVFRLFWRDPRINEHMMSLMLPSVRGVSEERVAKPAERRAAEALLGSHSSPPEAEQIGDEDVGIEIGAAASAQERLKSLDFELMSNAEISEAKRLIAKLVPHTRQKPSRRFETAPHGPRIDRRRSFRQAMSHGGDLFELAREDRRKRPPDLIALCDISGSMAVYSRVLLHFLHSLITHRNNGLGRVSAFTFGTRLTDVTRHLHARDVDEALERAGNAAQDWDGGTRIATSLMAFNRLWHGRQMRSDTIVLLVTDGLERGPVEPLERAMDRLARRTRRILWINPLLRWSGFAPKAGGIGAILPRVSSLRAGHSVASIEGLAAALADPDQSGEKDRFMALMRADRLAQAHS